MDRMLVIGLKEPNNYLEGNIEYMIQISQADVKTIVEELIMKKGLAMVLVARLSAVWIRSVKKLDGSE